MKNCSDFQETLWSDVHGELGPDERLAWEEHLAGCAACREEREKMLYLMERVKEELSDSKLSREEAYALSRTIKGRLRAEITGVPWWRRFISAPRRFVPAAAVAMLLVLAVAWFSEEIFRSTTGVNPPDSGNKMVVTDGEVIRNLEFLEEMDTLQKLVQVLDEKETM
ncbi:MAG: zf-HC2 domain-containing protein [Deltaproteobacteria bacterium]|jgi:anti-sigma factor RsiW